MLPTDCVRTSSAPGTATAPQENEYEIHNRHTFAHDIDCHNRCGCAGWNRAWSSEVANHRATADTCADDCFAGRASVEAFPAQVTISFNDEIANWSRQGLRGFSECVRRAHFARPRRIGSVVARDATADSDAASPLQRPPQWFLHTPLQEVISEEHPSDAAHEVARAFGSTVRAESTAGSTSSPTSCIMLGPTDCVSVGATSKSLFLVGVVALVT